MINKMIRFLLIVLVMLTLYGCSTCPICGRWGTIVSTETGERCTQCNYNWYKK